MTTVKNMKQKSVDVHDFAMIPRADIPRSGFPIQKGFKLPFDAAYLVPIFLEEVLPGDTWNVRCTLVTRTATPIVPIMDNWHIETFFFFVPNRIVWLNWVRLMGEQINPGESIAYTVPQVVSPVSGYPIGTLQDYMGLPCLGQVTTGATYQHSALPMRCYNAIYNQWFRDQNLQNSVPGNVATDGPDGNDNYVLLKRGKRHDYFTSALPFVQKGPSVTIPIGSSAPIVGTGAGAIPFWGAISGTKNLRVTNASTSVTLDTNASAAEPLTFAAVPLPAYADLTAATAATINQIRQSFQIQRLLERDARGGTRYTEIVRSHFGVISPDARLDRPEYLGGGRTPILTTAIPQTSATGVTGATTPIGTLAAIGHAQGSHGFTYAATEHGHIMGLVNVRADLTYQAGMRKLWSRKTRYDFYFPVFAMLGEQAVLNKEIFLRGDANDELVFGYQERWAEYRYLPSQIVGLFKSTAAGTIDYWHSAQHFANLPTLAATFIQDQSDQVLQRNFAGGPLTAKQQFMTDIVFSGKMVRPMPTYSVPGMVDHF